MNYLGVGNFEILVILMVALIVFGPHKIPELARYIAKLTKMFREASNELQRQLDVQNWDVEPKSKKKPEITSYTAPSESSDGAAVSSTYDSSSAYGASDSSSSSGSSESSAAVKDPYSYSGEGSGSPTSETPSYTAPKPIEEPNKIDDAQRYAREMTD